MISIDLSETTQKSALEIWDKFSLRQNAIWDQIQSEKISENFFLIKFFPPTKFFPGWILSWTKKVFFLTKFFPAEFCLWLHSAVVFRMQSFNCSKLEHIMNFIVPTITPLIFSCPVTYLQDPTKWSSDLKVYITRHHQHACISII